MLVLKNLLNKKFSRVVVYCLVIKVPVVSCLKRQLLHSITVAIVCQELFQSFLNFFSVHCFSLASQLKHIITFAHILSRSILNFFQVLILLDTSFCFTFTEIPISYQIKQTEKEGFEPSRRY